MTGKKTNLGLAICLLASVLMLASAAHAASTNTLPWYESFDTLTNGFVFDGTNHMYTPALSATASVSNAEAYDGANSAYVPLEAVFSNLIDNSSSVVWVDMFVQVTLRDQEPAMDSSATAMFYFDTNGYAVVQDGSVANWKVLSKDVAGVAAPTVTTGEWARITVVHNYTDATWALMLKDRLLDDNINFINTGITQMHGLSVSNGTYLDSMLIDTNYPDFAETSIGSGSNTVLTGDADSDGMPDYWEIYYFEYAYVQGGGDDYDGDGRSSTSEYEMGTDPTDANSFSNNLAYRDGFESGIDGSLSGTWRGITISGTASLQSSEALEGSKSLALGEGSAEVVIDDSEGTNAWIQVYTRLQPFDDVPGVLSSNYVAGWCVMTNGDLLAFDESAWATCNVVSNVSAVSVSNWLGFAAHLDYANSNYDLYISTNASFGAHMRRANNASFAFNTNASASALTKITITNGNDGAEAYVDAVAASKAYTNTGVAALTNLVAYDRLAGTYNDAAMPPYNYTGDDDLLSGKVGDDLMRELLDGDKLHIYTGSNNVYFLNSSAWQKETGAEITTFEIYETMGMKIQRFGGVDAVAFYPYSNTVVMSSNIFIVGTNTPGTGWNQLTSPFSDTRYPNTGSGFQFNYPTNGDMIFKDNIWISYDGSIWKKGASAATMALNPNDSFWYYHRGTGMTWNVSGE